MIPIPKVQTSSESADDQAHHVDLAIKRERKLNNPRFINNLVKYYKTWIFSKLILPTAFDEKGLFMLDSIREIFDILGLAFESVHFVSESFGEYESNPTTIETLVWLIVGEGKTPVFVEYRGAEISHAMVATGINETIEGTV